MDGLSGWVGMACVYGPPASMGSKKAFVVKGRAIIVDDKPKKLRSFQSEMREAMRHTAPGAVLLGPVKVEMRCFIKRPLGHYGTGKNARVLKDSAPDRPTVKPDLDKILRAVCDCGTGLWFRDDAQIAQVGMQKLYADDGEERTEVVATAL